MGYEGDEEHEVIVEVEIRKNRSFKVADYDNYTVIIISLPRHH